MVLCGMIALAMICMHLERLHSVEEREFPPRPAPAPQAKAPSASDDNKSTKSDDGNSNSNSDARSPQILLVQMGRAATGEI